MNDGTTKRETAIHEAGHTVVSVALGWYPIEVTLLEGAHDWGGRLNVESGPGGVRVNRYDPKEDRFYRRDDATLAKMHARRRDRDEATITAAGVEAEMLFLPDALCPRGSTGDYYRIQDLAARHCRSEDARREYEDRAHRRAEKLLRVPKHWRAVLTLAEALMERETIPADDATAIIRAATGARPRNEQRIGAFALELEEVSA